MRLSTLLKEISRSPSPVTGIELATRLGISPSTVAAMLSALRASGQLGPEIRTEDAPDTCGSSGSCSMSCPGPENCSMVIDLNLTALEIRGSARSG